MTTNVIQGTAILCGCCPDGRHEKLGEVHGTAVSIRDKRHGDVHTVTLTARDLLVRWAGTADGSAIRAFVEGVLA